MKLRLVIDNTFDPAFLAFGLGIVALCILFIVAHLILFRGDGSSRWGLNPIQSGLIRIITNLFAGRPAPELPWKWYDWCLLSGIGVGIVVLMGWS